MHVALEPDPLVSFQLSVSVKSIQGASKPKFQSFVFLRFVSEEFIQILDWLSQ